MPALICGSLAFDTITTFPGRFAQQILPEQVHILNVSFLVPTLRREFGGCAGNIAYTLAQLGGEPVVLAAVGADGHEYVQRLRSWNADTSCVRVVDDSYTAQAIIITDSLYVSVPTAARERAVFSTLMSSMRRGGSSLQPA